MVFMLRGVFVCSLFRFDVIDVSLCENGVFFFWWCLQLITECFLILYLEIKNMLKTQVISHLEFLFLRCWR